MEQQHATITPKVIEATISMPRARVLVTDHFWLIWGHIALQNEAAALRARVEGRAAKARGDNISPHFVKEICPSMIAVAAVTHAVDAIYGAVKRHVKVPQHVIDAWEQNKTPRHDRIRETFNRGFKLGNERGRRWNKEFTRLWGLRDEEIHYEERAEEPVPHPLGTRTSIAYVLYSAETATEAVDLFLDVMDVFTSRPKPDLQRLPSYRRSYEEMIETRRELREDGIKP